MKVMHVLEATVGGVALHARLVAAGQARRGYDVAIAGPQSRSDGLSDPRFWAEVEAAGVVPIVVGFRKLPVSPRNVRTARRLREHISSWQPDIVHSHSLTAGAVARPMAKGLGPRTVHTPNGVRFAAQRRSAGWFAELAVERLMAPFTDFVIATCPSESGVLRRAYRSTPMAEVPNCIEVSSEDPPPLPDRAAVAWVGRLSREKQPDQAVRIFADVRRRRPDVEATIVGDGPHAGRINDLIRRVDPGIKLVRGGAPGVEVIARSSVLLMTSEREGGPHVILEAMSLGRPVVAPDVVGCKDMVVHGRTGFIFAPDSPSEAVGYLERVVSDAELAATLGAEGRARMLSRHTVEHTVDAIDAVYGAVQRAT